MTGLDVHDAVLAYLRTLLPSGAVHDGTVTAPAVDAAGRVQPYLVLWFAPGTGPERSVTGPVGAEHRLHVTAAGGDVTRCLWAADRAGSALTDHRLTVAGGEVVIRWLPGYTPPPAREDRDVSPTRWFVPLIFTATAA